MDMIRDGLGELQMAEAEHDHRTSVHRINPDRLKTEEDAFKWKAEEMTRARLRFIASDWNLRSPAEIQGYRKALEWVLREVLGVSVI
jgi:hypothetical protein